MENTTPAEDMPMAHAPLPVLGYQAQPDAKIELVNFNKKLEELVLRTLDNLAKQPDVDPRMLAIGRTNIQLGFMAINNAVFQPARIDGPISLN